MKIFFAIHSLFFLTFNGIDPANLPVYVTGHLQKNPTDSSAPLSGASVFVKGNNKILAKATTDFKGDFDLSFVPGKEKSFDFYYANKNQDTLLLQSFTSFESDTPDIIFPVPGIPKTSRTGDISCPKCKKASRVFTIEYGDGLPIIFDNENDSSPSTGSRINKKVMYAGCIIGLAKFYCSRDKVYF
jgi:hypothetical protein